MINIFVHGTLFFFLKLPFTSSFFCSPKGLIPVKNLNNNYQVKKIAISLNKRDPKKFPIDQFYSYGWSGELSFAARNQIAHDFYHEIIDLISKYKSKTGKTPKIRIITHSHGGNVALQLGQWAKDHQDKNFKIDELILLACPVQKETKSYIKDKCFKKVYSLYSYADMIQVADPQGLEKLKKLKVRKWWNKLKQEPLFSERIFPKNKNLIQASIRLDKYQLLHVDFLRLKFFKALPDILNFLDQDKKRPFLRKTKSGEINLKLISKNKKFRK